MSTTGTTLARAYILREWQQRFVDSLRVCPIVAEACVAGNVGRRLAYKWRDKDKAFREAWDDALEEGWDRAESAGYKRGVEGVEVPVIGKGGEIVGSKVEYSDRLLEFMLKGNRAEKYREKQSGAQLHIVAGLDELLGALVCKGLPQEPPKATESPVIDVELTDAAGDTREGP